MGYADPDENREYIRQYTSAENVWRPYIFRADLPDPYIKAIRIQAQIDEATLSGVMSRYIKEGLAKDGRIKATT